MPNAKKGKVKVTCKVAFAKATPVKLTRAGRTVARGTATKGTVRFLVRPGRYTLKAGTTSIVLRA